MSQRKIRKRGGLALALVASQALTGCFGVSNLDISGATTGSGTGSGSGSGSGNGTSRPTLSLPDGSSAVRAARVIFSTGTSGSFNTAPTNGTPAAKGSGHPVVRLFHPDDTLMVEGDSSSAGWPAWISRIEIGISGSANTSAANPACARFAGAAEGATRCDFGKDGTVDDECGAPTNVYRVSDYDCVRNADTLNGTGSDSDGVYVRIRLGTRGTTLGEHENLMAVLTYSAATLRAGPTNPAVCFGASGFNPTNLECADLVWNVYLKDPAVTSTTPHLMLIPPTQSQVIGGLTPGKTGVSVSSRQIVLPIAAHPTADEIQISRVRGLPFDHGANSTDYALRCNGRDPTQAGNPPPFTAEANSPGCMGVILYSLTLYRI